jgi:hypothetical protein
VSLQNGTFGTAAATLAYSGGRSRAWFSASAGAAGDYNPSYDDLAILKSNGQASFGMKLGRKATLSGFGSLRYEPYYQFDVATGTASLPPISPLTRPETISKLDSHGSDGRIQLSEKLGRRTVLTVDYSYRYTQLSVTPEAFLWQVASTRLVQPLTRHVALRFGYGYGEVQEGFGTDISMTSHNTDVGIDYSPRASARRPTLGVSSGVSVVMFQGVSYSRPRAVASLIQPIAGSWSVRGEYHRGFQFVEGLDGPIYSDTTQVRLTGRTTRRTDATVSVDYSRGQIGLTPADLGFSAYSGTADFRVALGRGLWLDTQYVRYFYNFDPAAILLPNVPPRLERQGIRFGLTGTVPLSRRRGPRNTGTAGNRAP